jgi:iron(III) transport system substrate-binding protein
MKGAPVAALPLDPIPSNPSVMVLLKNAPHPHAALLLMDFMISKEGQEVIAHADYFPSDTTIPLGKAVESIVPDKIGKKMLFLSEETLFSNRTKTNDILKRNFQRR